VGFVLRPGGEQALANVLHVAELARQYEMEGGMSFRGFVETLQAEASVHRPAEAPILEEGSDGVRLMTVHKAKGLEFPVVILADITARLTPWDASRHIDPARKLCALRIGGWSPKDLNDAREIELQRECAEGERVAYVAATRARDLLVVPGVGDEPYTEGWIAPLNAAVYPREDARREYTPARGCPLFKSRDSVLKRPDGDPASFLTVCPGAHEVGDGADSPVSVVWWAPDALSLGAQASFGLRRDDLIVKDVPPDVLRRHLDRYEHWRTARQTAIDAAGVPSVRVMTATEWAGKAGKTGSGVRDPGSGADIEVTIESAGERGVRPGGARFGSLVHALLADMPLGGGEDTIARLADVHGRVIGANPDEVAAAQEIAARAARHPLLVAAARAAAAGQCYRETPVTWRLEDQTIIEGHVDLAYLEGDDVVVIDFKTDRELDGAIDAYTRQVQIYAAAVGAALGKQPRAVLMRL
jgi:ATP-dependent exoDNAse (exonuclease V) beta subunit